MREPVRVKGKDPDKAKNMEKNIRRQVEGVRSRIAAAAGRVGRAPEEVAILAATKNRIVREIRDAIEAGVRVAGENRVQELLSKQADLGSAVEWHFIGHLQRNKVKKIVGAVELIHSVDGLELASEVARRAMHMGIRQKVLVQVNVAGEESKFGLEPAGAATLLEEIGGIEGLELLGLSTIAPLVDDPEEVRWVFRDLKELGAQLEIEFDGFECRELSMGMTNDYEVAVEEGSTIVRIGSAIFGPISSESKVQ